MLIKTFIKNKIILINLAGNLFFNLFLWLLLFLKIKPQEAPLLLHYNIYFGIDLIGEWYKVFLIPFSGLAIFLLNLIFSFIIYKKDKILSYFPLIVSLIIQIILFIGGILIILLNS